MEQKELDKPGQADNLIKPSEAKKRNPEFFNSRPASWKLKVTKPDGSIEELVGVDWEAISPFGAVRSAVVTDENGQPLFDRPRVEEAPNVNVVAWGRDRKTREVKVAFISQPRPHADDPINKENKDQLVFSHIPMGFKDKIFGKDQIERFENSKEAAAREALEESGASVILDVFEPQYPYHNPAPSFVGSWSDIVFVEVDLEKISELKVDRSEPIFKAEYVPLKQVWKEIKEGKTDRGITRACNSNSALLIYLSYLGELYKRSRDRD